AGMLRRPPSGKARHREIEAAPEEMHRGDLAEEGTAEMREHMVGGEQDAPEAVGIIAIIGRMHAILGKRDGIRDLVGHCVDADVEPEIGERGENLHIELGDRRRLEYELAYMAVAHAQPKHVIDE